MQDQLGSFISDFQFDQDVHSEPLQLLEQDAEIFFRTLALLLFYVHHQIIYLFQFFN